MAGTTSLGKHALANNAGNDNTAVGWYSSSQNTSGFQNTSVGSNTLLLNTTGSNNCSLGSGSMVSSVSGNDNTAVGSSSLALLVSGNDNVAVGTAAAYSINGNNNTAVGTSALCNAVSGNGNVALGADSGIDNTVYNYNTLLGAGTDTASNSVQYATAIGVGAVVDMSNTIMMGGLNPPSDPSASYPLVVAPGGLQAPGLQFNYPTGIPTAAVSNGGIGSYYTSVQTGTFVNSGSGAQLSQNLVYGPFSPGFWLLNFNFYSTGLPSGSFLSIYNTNFPGATAPILESSGGTLLWNDFGATYQTSPPGFLPPNSGVFQPMCVTGLLSTSSMGYLVSQGQCTLIINPISSQPSTTNINIGLFALRIA